MKQKGLRFPRAVRELPRCSRSCGVSRPLLFPQESASFLLHPVFRLAFIREKRMGHRNGPVSALSPAEHVPMNRLFYALLL
ncbi:hypothetical protein [Domibacillus tundrae]|uniref:hypothetical protein n=1 Tax=Domibacillus tundrae TaxID=1587527 RepID=UPI000617B209|nr:hypothetical protein [Domibacillus tundrae]